MKIKLKSNHEWFSIVPTDVNRQNSYQNCAMLQIAKHMVTKQQTLTRCRRSGGHHNIKTAINMILAAQIAKKSPALHIKAVKKQNNMVIYRGPQKNQKTNKDERIAQKNSN